MESTSTPKVIFLIADYGHDPTETAIPYAAFKSAGFSISFATETGKLPECDKKMLTGQAQKLLVYAYQLVSLPGGHDKGVQQVIDSASVQKHLVSYFPQTRKAGGAGKAVAAVCHGELGLSEAKGPDGRSVLFDASTAALPGAMEQGFFWATRAVLGDYYRTYGAGSESVEAAVRRSLRDSQKQYKNSHSTNPFVVSDKTYNYVSGRFPPDAQLLAKKAVEVVRSNLK